MKKRILSAFVLTLAVFLTAFCTEVQSSRRMESFYGIPFGTSVKESRSLIRKAGWVKFFTIRDKENDAQIMLFHSFYAKYEGERTNYLVAFFSRDRFAGAMLLFKNGISDETLKLLSDTFTQAYDLSVADEDFFLAHEEEFTPAFNFEIFNSISVPSRGPEGESQKDFENMELTQEPVAYAYHDQNLTTVMMATLRTDKKTFSGIGAVSPSHFH